ncbi:enoyl-CoA-hydratase DpgB [Streptomyces sp. NPDC049577]|uniref:enoyl-CoA-hydratase DpgB n=1 Tax=Streptomyces sp. NPDC049577 TaxID=3155153 RepID=UPI0034456B19
MTVRENGPGLAGALALTWETGRNRPLAELTASLDAVCDRAEDAADRAAVITLRLGTTAPDERAWPEETTVRQVGRWEKAVRRLERLPAVSIAVAGDTCGGPALDLLLAADYRIATAGLRLLLPVHTGRLWPGMAVHRLAHQIGTARARQLLLWGSELTAERGLRLGLIDETVDDTTEALRAATLLLGRAAGPDLAVLRQLLEEAPVTSFDEALGVHLAACDRELRRRRRTGEPAATDPGSADR